MTVPIKSLITIRDADPRLVERLQARARESGRSLEDEARAILAERLPRRALSPINLAEAIRQRVAPLGGVDLDQHPPVAIGEPPIRG